MTSSGRADRLVVDDGFHALGWSRQQAIEWMGDDEPLRPVEIVSEVDRYISMPGQALWYTVVPLEIQELRRVASVVLGQRFDGRALRDTNLATGRVPLTVLAGAVRRWITGRYAPRV